MTSTKELGDAGEETDGAITSKSKLRSKILALSGVDILTDTGAYKSTYEILLDISRVWEKMSDIDQAALLEIIAGKTRSNTAAAILSNTTDLENAYVDALHAEGSALRENEKYLDSIQGRINLFNNSVQTLWSNLLSSDVIKGIVGMATKLVELLDSANKNVGVFKTALAGLAIGAMIKGKMGPIGLLSSLIELLIDGSAKVKEFGGYLNHLRKSSNGLSTALGDLIKSQANLQASTIATQFNEKQLTAEQLRRKLATFGLSDSVAALTAKEMNSALVRKGLSKTQKDAIIQTLGLGKQTKALTAVEIKNAMAAAGVKDATIQATLAELGLSTANKGLAASFGVLWKAIWPMLAIGAIIAIIYGIVKAVDKAIITNDELAESIEHTRSEIESLKSDIKNLNDQIEETQKRISELLSMPSLSFTEQEELANLQRQNAELERTIALKEALKAQKEEQNKTDTKKQIKNTWYNKSNGKKDYSIDAYGVITYDDFWSEGIGGKDAFNQALEKYKVQDKRERFVADAIIAKQNGIAYADFIKGADSDVRYTVGESIYNDEAQLEEKIKYYQDQKDQISEGISLVLGDMATLAEGLSYGDDEDINKFLDELNYSNLKWQEAQGVSTTSSAIKAMFDDTQNQATKNIETKLKAIATSEEYADTEEGNAKRIADATQVVQSALDNQTDTYDRLKIAMDTIGLSAEQVARYFVQLGEAPDSESVEGIMAQYQKGIEVLKQFKSQQAIVYENLNGETEIIRFDDLFKKNDADGKFEAIDTQIAKVLQGADETVRKEFGKIIETVKNDGKELEDAISQFNLHGFQSVIDFAKKDLSSLNGELFKDIKDDISGLIDTFDELSKALDDVSNSMDLLHTAQNQMTTSGRISVKTALQLIESTEDWDKILNINNGTVTLAANAEEILIQTKLDAIKTNIDLAIAEVENKIALLEGANASAQAGDTFAKNFTSRLIDCQGILVGLKAAWDAFWSGGDVVGAFNSARNAVVNREAKNAADLSDLYEQQKKLYAQRDLLGNVDTSKDFKKYYDYDKTPGDKYQDGTIKDLFDKLAAKYDREIQLLSNEKELIQAEIDKAEARGEIASESYYERLIELEELEKQKLIEKKAALEGFLKANGSAMTQEDWADANNTINETALAIKTCEKNVIDYGKAIEDIHWEYFDKANDEIDSLADEIQWLNSLLEDEKMANDDGTWTEAAITRMALYQSQMEYAAVMAKRYGDEIESLTEKYKAGEISEIEYQEKLRELEGSQRDMIDSYNDAKDGLVDLNRARVDAIKDGIDKEIKAYQELINLRKEELDSERDLYDFKKSVEKQNLDIAKTQRKLASLSGSTAAADVAERRKLEAQLREQKEGLNDTYYDHAKSAQQTALDREMELFEDTRNKYIEGLEKTLEEVDRLVEEAIKTATINADTAYAGLLELAQTYSINVSPELTDPWKKAAAQATEWKNQLGIDLDEAVTTIIDPAAYDLENKLGTAWTNVQLKAKNYADYLTKGEMGKDFNGVISGFASQIQTIIDKWKGVKAAAEDAARAQVDAIKTETPTSNKGSNSTTSGTTNNSNNKNNTPTNGKGDPKVLALQEFLNNYFNAKLETDGSYGPATKAAVKSMQTTINKVLTKDVPVDGNYGPKTVSGLQTYYDLLIEQTRSQGSSSMIGQGIQEYNKRKRAIPASYYAKGTFGTKRDGWAITDEPEWGDELTLVPGKAGNLSFIRKGTSVIPADITKNLVDWGMMNPSDMMANNIVRPVINTVATNNNFNNLSFDSLVHIDNCTQDSVDQVKKIVNDSLDKFTRQLNYRLKHA